MAALLPRAVLAPLLLATSLLIACTPPRTPLSSGAPTAQPGASDTSVAVEYVNPSSFAELRQHPQQGERYNEQWMAALRAHLERQAPRYLPAGTRLRVRFTDVRLAGDYEPWHRARMQGTDVRIVRDIYPPRIDLDFQLSANGGQIVREGRRELRDPAFLTRARRYPDDPLGYEKQMLDKWLVDEFEGN